MPKISGITPDVIARTKLVLHSHSAAGYMQKGNHLKVIGTPVGCPPRALRCLNVSRGPGHSGDPIGSTPWRSQWGTLGWAKAGTNGRSPNLSRRQKSAM
ncbi:hypothetical protein TIFTF001_020734 [Ficus carica]|uniref:Uncharacterized protein n=1 Tax=Ficus carica TaxID=3494 RepID=A0AA88AJ63_FICCA|nr:hypothetical protein TIFTF001_020734 [Ficus carica]